MHRGQISNRLAQQPRRLIQIRRDQSREGKKFALVSLNCLRCKQYVTAGRDHDRIDHQLAPFRLAQTPHHFRDDCGVAKKTGFDRRHREILQQQLDLFMHGFGIGRLNS